MKQKILVIGATGFIGQHTIRKLLDADHTIYATHLPDESLPSKPGTTWIPCDLASTDITKNWPEDIESVIYLAQSQTWRSFPDGAVNTYKVNVEAVFQAVEYSRKIGVHRFIYTSTGSLYGQKIKPADEGDLINLSNLDRFYDTTKLAAELLLGPYSVFFPVIIMRLFMPYGRGLHPDMLLSQLVQRVRSGTPIFLHGNDGMSTNPVAIADVVEVLERCLSLKKSAMFNVAGPEILTLRQIGEQIGHVLGKEVFFEVDPLCTPPVIVGKNDLIQSVLGWRPQTKLETGLRSWLINPNGS